MIENVLEVNIQGSARSLAARDVAQLLYLLTDIQAPKVAADDYPSLNTCLVVDRSTSMRGERLESVKSAIGLIVDKLGANDKFSVVSFSDRAEVIVAAAPVENKTATMAEVNRIVASGGTEIYQGLLAGYGELHKSHLRKHTNHLILLTDGHTYGDDEECLELAFTAADKGIEFTAFGIGSDWNDQFLDRLVAPSGGYSTYVESPAQVVDSLLHRIQGLGAVYARNVSLVADFPSGVKLNSVFKVAPFAQPLSLDDHGVRLGVVDGKSPLLILLEFVIESQQTFRRLQLPVNLMADIPSRKIRGRILQHEYSLSIVPDDPEIDPSKNLVDAVQALNFYRMSERVWDDVEAGQLEGATVRMSRLTTRLLQAGHTELARQAFTEAERLKSVGSLSFQGRKRLRYGTRALFSQSFGMVE